MIAYTQFQTDNKELYDLFESYEVYDNRGSFDVFSRLHLKRWQRFAENSESFDEIIVFECAYLQNHINELLFFNNMDTMKIKEHLFSLIDSVSRLNPVLFYLTQPIKRRANVV